MRASYSWLKEYLPLPLEPEELGRILTAIGLEVESLEWMEQVPGSLEGLLIGEVLQMRPHPNADKLKLTLVSVGTAEPLAIVCGAPNVTVGQKVVVAPVGSTLHPFQGVPLTMKLARIRGELSQGMICAEDEIGLGPDHAGILVLPASLVPGTPARDYFQPARDWIYQIGLTPNRMDAMSHLGIARDICAFLSNRDQKSYRPRVPQLPDLPEASSEEEFRVYIEAQEACLRYAGIGLRNIEVKESPLWLKNRLLSLGLRPINNVVDVTNFVLHETGQPLHAFDAEAIQGREIHVRTLAAGTPFLCLDEKTRSLHPEDLMICNAREPMCIAGVFGGLRSGVQARTRNLFLESAVFAPDSIRRTSFRHGLRTDAALRFEKGVDVSTVLYALKRAASLILELAGGELATRLIDVYPNPLPQRELQLQLGYLHKLSGRLYPASQVVSLLEALGFGVRQTGPDTLELIVPYSKSDVHLPADVAEEVMRIDGYDHIDIPGHIRLAPAAASSAAELLRRKLAGYLSAQGFRETMTNSITNSRYYTGSPLEGSLIRMINNLSQELDVLRPSMLESGLEVLAYNLNRRQQNLLLFEFGKIYRRQAGSYLEQSQLLLFTCGKKHPDSWMGKAPEAGPYFLKAQVSNLLQLMGLEPLRSNWPGVPLGSDALDLFSGEAAIGTLGRVDPRLRERFDVRLEVWYAQLHWDVLLRLHRQAPPRLREIPPYPSVRRDLALVVSRSVSYAAMEKAVAGARVRFLEDMQLFDVFESDKLGADKKSMAISFQFQHPDKTLTDKEVDQQMQKLAQVLEQELQAEIRK